MTPLCPRRSATPPPVSGNSYSRLLSQGLWMIEMARELNLSTVPLYRPVGQKELDLIRQSGFRAFPPRLEHQPIFYPVLNERYAMQIARDWNTKDAASGHVGYVTRFLVDATFLSKYAVQKVGSSQA